ncbi:hypothetical protein ENUP19_0040G0006 [Entamoeba nuttalli]|uniref:Uncharacterized protein n=2 Tax=Entamoeba nuttalli TaxID=412467 RepID=K2HWZ2_ENTNP|nr:hypothetical protein ENU1_078470 [Entamoeba nuttalli P19]EKE40820.1 hypothetical protein ENU1_078470 [Entamoeba nuttalli P19]|eukprot:XP_008856849.1 hypothetical protein ENU1_078470 [Entamoeba nuttalli P19]
MKPEQHKQITIEAINNYGVVNLNLVDPSYPKESGNFETHSSLSKLGETENNKGVETQDSLPILRYVNIPLSDKTLELSTIPIRNQSKKPDNHQEDEKAPKQTHSNQKKNELQHDFRSKIISKSINLQSPEKRFNYKKTISKEQLSDISDLSTIPKQPESLFTEPFLIHPHSEIKLNHERSKKNEITLSCCDIGTTVTHFTDISPVIQPTAIKEMTLISEYMDDLSKLMGKQYFQVIFDGISYYEGISSIQHAFQNKDISIIFETDEGVFGVNHHIETGEKWNRDFDLSIFCLRSKKIQTPSLFRCYRYSSSRLISHSYEVLGFCTYNIDTSIMTINNKFHVHFIDFTGKGPYVFASELNKIKVNSFSVIQWI